MAVFRLLLVILDVLFIILCMIECSGDLEASYSAVPYIMALMVVANIPLLYFLNKEWYGALMYTTFGKITLAICGAVMLFTFLRMQKYCKPVEYRR